MDAFDVLGLAPAFDLDEKQLEQRYRDLQRALHPDRFAQASASERRASLSRAVSVNDAYRALRDDLKRAELVLTRFSASGAEREQPADPELLLEVMELREQLGESKASGDVTLRERLTSRVNDQDRGARADLRAAFAQLSQGDAHAHELAARSLSRLRYYRRFLDEVAVIEDAQD